MSDVKPNLTDAEIRSALADIARAIDELDDAVSWTDAEDGRIIRTGKGLSRPLKDAIAKLTWLDGPRRDGG